MAGVVKKISLFVFVLSALCLSSCSKYSVFVDEGAVIKENAKQMMQCVIDRDAEKLLTFFPADMQENESEETLEEIGTLFEFIDGDIVSYSYHSGSKSGSMSEFEHDYYYCTPEFRKIETTTGKIYTLQFGYQYIWKEKPEYEGLNKITIFPGESWADLDKGVVVGKNRYDPPDGVF